MSTTWDYGGAHRRHDMSGAIDLPNQSRVMVKDIVEGLPNWMRRADTIFTDPPCSLGNLRSFHTKADRDLGYSFTTFTQALFSGIDEISPRHLFIEVFQSNRDNYTALVRARYPHVRVYQSCYYGRTANCCWVVHGSIEPLPDYPLDGLDESKIIAWLCHHHHYDCIGDPCMGRGLVGRHAYLAGKPFVGTELNLKRLAVLVEFIRKQEEKQGTC